ncbi:MAG: hypothetical protein QXX64_04280, partial [Nitrososphaera sp.]
VAKIECIRIEGVDRNLCNLTVGNYQQMKQYDLSKAVGITEREYMFSIIKSFKRNDVRIRRKGSMANTEREED